jgi:acyl-CoA thioesterase
MGATVMTLGINPMTVEMKVNYLSPGGTDGKLIAIGKIVKNGRTLVIAESEVYYKDKMIAKSLGTYFVER